MGYQPYTNTVATDETNRRNSRIALEDQLKNSASTRDLQAAQASATGLNAAANMSNASTSRASLALEDKKINSQTALQSAELGLKAAAIGEDARQADRRYELDSSRLGMDAAKLGPEIDQLNLTNDTMRLEYGTKLLDFHMQKAMTEHNLSNLPKLFAMQDIMLDAKTIGYKSEIGLQKWGLLARYGSGISNALDAGRQQDALSLYESLQKEIDDMGIDKSNLGILNNPPTNDNKDTWKLFSDTAINSAEFRSKLALTQATQGGNVLENLLKLAQLNLSNGRDGRGAEDQTAQNVASLQKEIGTVIAPAFNVQINKDGNVKPNAAGVDTSGSYQSVQQVLQGATMDPSTGKFRDGMNLALAKNLAINFTQRTKSVDVDTPGWGSAPFVLKSTGILPNAQGGLLFQDPAAEIDAVMDPNKYQTVIKGGLKNFIDLYAKNNPKVQQGITQTVQQMNNMTDPMQRARTFESLVHVLTTMQILGQ